MSARDKLHEVMSRHDLVSDCDTDAVSVTSTDAGSIGDFYDAERIIAEESGEDDEPNYLVKWENYPLHEYGRTWEPPANLDATDLIKDWERVKQELGQAAFERENAENQAAFLEAQERADAIRERRHEKRAKKRQRLKRLAHQVAVPDDDSDSDVPLSTTRRRSKEQQTGSPNRESLFVENQEPSVPASTLATSSYVRQPPVAHRAPFQQSSSEEDSDSDVQTYDDSLMGEQRRKRKTKKNADRIEAERSMGNSLLQPKSPKKAEAVSKKPRKSDATNVENQARDIRSSKAAMNSTAQVQQVRVEEKRVKTPRSPVREMTAQRPAVSTVSTAASASGAKNGSTVVSATSSISTANRTSNSTVNRTAPQQQEPRAINFVDRPKEQRKEWSSDKHYSTLKFRYNAEKRSRIEGTPDFNALDFVHGPPPTLPKAPVPAARGDPYGRRDISNLRVQEDDPDDRPRRGAAHDPAPLADWETDKVPLVCASWRLSQNCPYGAQKCLFMHRDIDPRGREYPIGNLFGWVPPKYRKPPITCFYWYKGGNCSKSAEQCSYAHEDTGWAEFKGEPVRIELLPDTATGPALREGPPGWVSPKNQNPPITCPYWLWQEKGCNKTDDDCKYAHWNTGWVPPKDNVKGKPIQINPNQRPRGTQSKFASPPMEIDRNEGPRKIEPKRITGLMPTERSLITCAYWLRGLNGCTKTAEECVFAHTNTGWIPKNMEKGGPPVRIDPEEKPRSELLRIQNPQRSDPKNAVPPITCHFWLRNFSGCDKPDSFCRYAHRNTGWYAPPNSFKPVQIDPNEEPRYRKYDTITTPTSNGDHTSRSAPVVASGPRNESGSNMSLDAMDHVAPTFEPQSIDSSISAKEDPPVQLLTAITCGQLNRKIEQIFKLDITKLFASNSHVDQRAMLLYHPEDHSENLELITRWLLMHGVEVGNAWYDGAWSYFRQQITEDKLGIIIAHPEFENFTNIPNFGEVLKKQVPVWSIGLQATHNYEPGVSTAASDFRNDCIRIFPHGGFIYITDEVFERKPQLALRIVKLFFAKIEKLRSLDGPVSAGHVVDDACLLWRLCVRPELMDHLYQKCEDNAMELAAENPDYLSRADLYQLLTATEYIEQDNPSEPLSLIQDKFPILSERRVIAESQPLDYFGRLAHSQEDANANMIRYYAAVQVDMRHDYRHFYVVHTEPSAVYAQRWKQDVQTIAEIITPEQCIEELDKESKESKFDFLDWAMADKEKELGEAPMEID